MSPKYSPPSVEAILEAPEDEPRGEIRGKEGGLEKVLSPRRQEYLHESTMATTRISSQRHKDRPKRSHKSAPSSSVGRNSTRDNSKPASKRTIPPASRDDLSSGVRHKHQRTRSNRSDASSNSSTDDEDTNEDHRVVLAAARERLTSPSLISTLTSLTTATSNSGGSSGSNSTITQTSMSRHSASKQPDLMPEASVSPAVPDAPDVFAYLENDSSSEEEDPAEEVKAEAEWLSQGIYQPSMPRNLTPPSNRSMSSSASSSFHSDDGRSELPADNETDRSTSPERSVKGEDSARIDPARPTEPAASKLASQMLAAQQRQSLHGTFQSFGTPQMPRGNAILPHISRLPQHVQQHSLPRAEKLPVTGYEALASKLSCHSKSSSSIKPIYRKFERLNHRLLLHLQDELAELEEQLHRLDNADTQTRSLAAGPPAAKLRIMPASRRAAAHAGGELEWHKIDLINKIAFKLGQYNQVLASFNQLSQELDVPEPSAVERYRVYLHAEKPVVETETRFLEPKGDLVEIGRKKQVEIHQKRKTQGEMSLEAILQFRILAVAVAAAVLVPILTFAVIPGFLGRMTVVMLVAMGTVGALIQSGVDGRDLLGKEWATYMMIYGVVMAVVAGVFS